MFDGDVAGRHEGHPEAFEFEHVAGVEQSEKLAETWDELPVKPSVPKLKGPGVTFKETRSKVFVDRDDDEEVQWYLKTPAVVRELRAYKHSNP